MYSCWCVILVFVLFILCVECTFDETSLRNKMQNIDCRTHLPAIIICFHFLLHTYVSDVKTNGNTILQHLFMNILALHISIKVNWKVLSCCVRGSSMFQSLESKVVSASSTLKVSNVCSWQYYYYRCHNVLEIKP